MRITGIAPTGVRVNARGDWIFLQVQTDEGVTGLGEASHSGNDALLWSLIADLEPRLLGADPTNINWLRTQMQGSGRIAATAWSAVEQACQDIRGQALGLPLYQVLGGKVRERIRLYANINRHVQERTPIHFARAAAAAVADGFTAIKLAPFDEVVASDRVRRGAAADWKPGLARVREVRAAVGPGIEVAVDCHGRFDAKEALAVAWALEELDLFWFEEPVPVERTASLARIAARIRQPLATAETLFGLPAFHRVLQAQAADVVMPDVKHAGGVQEVLRIGALAYICGAGLAPHNPSGPVATAASAHVAACAPAFRILEFAWGEVDWRAELLDPPERVEDGCLLLPETPGLGHALNPRTVRQFAIRQPSRADSSKAQP